MAIKKGVKKKEGENLSDANIERVISLLEAEKPITKKEACEILNISYNTTRLSKIIQEYHDKLAEEKRRRAANRGKAFEEYEVKEVIESFLVGEPVKEIADRMYRSTASVKRVVEEAGVPSVQTGENYFDFSPLPEKCVSETFEPGEYVWSSRYGSIAEVIKDIGEASDGSGARIYQIQVVQRLDPEAMKVDGRHYDIHLNSDKQVRTVGGFYAVQRAYDLGSLKHLVEKHKIDLKRAIK